MRYSCALYSLIYSVSIHYIHKQTLIYHNPCLHTAIYLLIYLVYNLVYRDLCTVYKVLCIVYKDLCIVYKLLGPLSPGTPHFYIPLYYLIFHLYTLIFSLTYPYIPSILAFGHPLMGRPAGTYNVVHMSTTTRS
jgi:hypothetical protein